MKLAVVLSAVMLAACSASDAGESRPLVDDQPSAFDPTSAETPTVATLPSAVSGPLIRFPTELNREVSPAAEISGVLEFENDCIYLRNDEVQERYVVVWPADTEWDSDQQVLRLPGGTRISLGDSYFEGGGYYDLEQISRAFGPEARELATRCVVDATASIAVVGGI